ncbi:MAG: serine protease [Xanthobacteraceae bacterium]|jgi:S1-C subfamily serine protease
MAFKLRRHLIRNIWMVLAAWPSIGFPADTTPTLTERYAKHSCAVVRIEGPQDSGTGFFINANGLLVTAAHVLFDRSFSKQGNNYPITLALHWPLNLVFQDGEKKIIARPILEQRDADNAIFDVAAIETGLKSECFITIGNPDSTNIGDPLISIGFPGSAASGVLYGGFLSAKHNQVPTVVGPVKDSTEVRMVSRDVMRIQMPITAGASGSPVIASDDTAVAIVSEIPVIWTSELSRLIQTMKNSPGGSGIMLSGFDTTVILAQLALIVKEFESPGAGLAVPISYLKLPVKSKHQ